MCQLYFTATFITLLTVYNSPLVNTDQTIACNPSKDPSCNCNPGLTGVDCDLDIDECQAQDACYEHGECINTHGSFYCNCTVGFSGPLCQFDIDECGLPNPPDCGIHAVCMDTYGSYSCVCEPGYTGTDCEIEINECEEIGCINGICTDLVNDFQCDCFTGWSGKQCEIDIDYCNVPETEFGYCYDIGTVECLDHNSTYTCACLVGFTGYNCSVDIDECALGLCLNNATCMDYLFGIYQCICQEGYEGQQCEIDLTPCDPNPCRYNSTCFDRDSFQDSFPNGNGQLDSLDVGEYYCECLPGFSGKNCSNECPGEPCQNNAECVDTPEYFTCNCPPGFSGALCETDQDFCTPTTCSNGGTCVDGIGDTVTCICMYGFSGSQCEVDLPFCQPESCLNNGTCIEELGNETSCSCLEGYGGERCEDDLDYCSDNTCRNGGTCVEGEGIVVTCFCPNGTVGLYCDSPPVDGGMNTVVLAVVIVLAVLALFFLVCFVATLCISAYCERKRGKRTKRGQMNLWTLEYRTPVALEDTTSETFNYRDVDLRYTDAISQASCESQTAMVRFTLNRGGNIINQPSNVFVRTLSARNHGRATNQDQTGDIRKEELVDVVERNLTTFQPEK